jgi:hypothetical protein
MTALPPTLAPDADGIARSVRAEWRLAGLALLLYGALAAALLHDTLGGEQVLSAAECVVVHGPFTDAQREGLSAANARFSDSYRHFEPWMRFAADTWAEHGTLPLWKDHTMLGAPLLGNGQSALLYPPNLASILAGAPPASASWRGLFKLVTGALCAFLLARHLRCSPVASLLAGLAFGFFGFGVVFLLWPLSNVSCLLPLVVLTALRAAGRPSGGRLVALAGACALQHLGGHPETALLSQGTAFVLAGLRIRRRGDGSAAVVRRTASVAGGFVLGALLAGPQLLPLAEYLLHSHALAERVATHGLHLGAEPLTMAAFLVCAAGALLAARRLVQLDRDPLRWGLALLVAVVLATRVAMGTPAIPDLSSFLVADWLGGPLRVRVPQSYIESVGVYVGPVLALSAAALLFGRPRRWVRTWAVLLVLALLLRARAPGLQDLVDAIPVLSLMPSARAGLLAQLALALLAALGYDALARPLSDPTARKRYVIVVLVPILAAGVSLAWATHAGVLGVGNVRAPGPERGEHLRMIVAPAGPLGDGPAVYRGSFAVPAPVEHATMHWSRRDPPTPLEVWRQDLPTPEGGGRFDFELRIPAHRLHAVTARMWLEVELSDGRMFASPPVLPRVDLLTLMTSVPTLPVDGRAGWQLALLLAMTAGVTVLLGRPERPRVLLAGVALLGLPAFTAEQLPRTPVDRHWPDSPALTVLRDEAPDARVYVPQARWLSETLGHERIPQLLGHDAVVPAHAASLLRAAVAPDGDGLAFRQLPAGRAPDPRLLDLLGVGVSLGPTADWPLQVFDGYAAGQRMALFRNEDASPRARLVGRARVEPDDERALALLADPGFDPVGELILAEGEPLDDDGSPAGDASIVATGPDGLEVDVAPERASYLLVSDTFFPGWVAEVDGVPRPILRADVALRAVAVGPGDRRVSFRYEPGSLRAGLWCLAVAIALCLALVLASWRAGGRPDADAAGS